MSHPSASTEPVSADVESSDSDDSGCSGKRNRDSRARAIALVVGMLVGTFIGMGIGVRIGNAIRKRLDYWFPRYLCLLIRATRLHHVAL